MTSPAVEDRVVNSPRPFDLEFEFSNSVAEDEISFDPG